jgi:hypothetical protein
MKKFTIFLEDLKPVLKKVENSVLNKLVGGG